ncbi:hypothetical protein [Pelagicoccus mobilis]|nr:hypothetical protein [Pelagicoccus mobilis]
MTSTLFNKLRLYTGNIVGAVQIVAAAALVLSLACLAVFLKR